MAATKNFSARSAGGRQGGGQGALIVASLVVLALVVTVWAVAARSLTKTQAGEIAVVRNGGPLDDNRIRQVVQPASSLTWIGLFSTKHTYPAQQRFYTITADAKSGDRAGVDVETLPTSDGVEVGIEGTVYFTLNTDAAVLRQFDDRYGTRTYLGADGERRYPWQDEAGWSSFLDQMVRPVISNALREQIGNVPCAKLQASCALVQNGAGLQDVSKNAGAANTNLAVIQEALNASLAADFVSTLGGAYLTDVKFNLAKITLPTEVQKAITKAQAAFAAVSEAQARVEQARADAKANEERQKGYAACPACAQIDTLAAIPPTVTTFAPGSGFSITSK